MDPVSHALFARGLNCLDSGRRFGRGAGAAFVLGSLAPDIDGALVTRGWDVYLHYHQMGTHALIASPALAAATAGLVRVLRRGSRYRQLFVAALIGIVVGHLSLDLVSGSDMRLLAPFSSHVVGPHLLTMADWSAVVVLLAGTLVSWWRRRAGGLVIAAGIAALVGVKVISMQAAWRVYEPNAGAVSIVGRPEAVNGSLTEWRFYDRAGDVARVWTVDGWRRRAAIEFTRAVSGAHDVSLVERSKAAPAVQRFLGFGEIPIVRVEQAAGERQVVWSDLKYCDAKSCVMSFGAIFDDRAEPIRDIVRIGGFIRTRDLK